MIDQIGGPNLYNNYPRGWAQVGNTPLRYYKQNTYEGSIRDPLIVHWPNGTSDAGAIRDQYHHVIDVTPTIFDVLGSEAPRILKGIEQQPVESISFRSTFDADAAGKPSERKVQYFEMLDHRAIWSEGWKAVTMHRYRAPLRRGRVGPLRHDEELRRGPRPERGAPRQAPRADRAVVDRGREVQRTAAGRPRRRALRPETDAGLQFRSPASVSPRPCPTTNGRSDPGPRCRTDRAARNSARQTDLGTDSRRTWRVLSHRARPVGQSAAFDRSSSRRSGSVGVTSYPPGNGGRAGNPRPTRTAGSW